MKQFSRMAALLAGASVLAMTGCDNMKQIKHLPYPETARGEVVDNYFGTEVPDPYRWLEDDNSEATAAWVAAENAVTEDYLSQIPFRNAIRERLTQLWNYPKEGAPSKHGDWYYYYYNDGLQNQSVLCRTQQPGEAGEVFLDPNTLSEDGTVALSAVSFSKNGRYFAYAAAASGSDWVEIRVMDTETKTRTEDRIEWVKFSGAVWAPDSKGFYYSAYDAPKEGVYSAQNQFQKVYYHKLGTPQTADRLIYEDKAHPLRYFSAWPSEDGKWLFVIASEGTSGTEILCRKTSETKFRTLLAGFDHDYAPVDCKEDNLYFVTNEGASNYTLKRIALTAPAKVETVIPEHEKNLLEGVGTAGGYLFASYLQDAQNQVVQYDYDGRLVREIVLPAIGTVGGFSGEEEDTELYYSLANYTAPATIYRYDIASGESTLYKSPEVAFDPALFVTEQVFYPSKDGTQVPMFITRRKDMKLDGKNPCLLYGYGGFQINLTPGFNPSALMFVEQGGVYCVANLRGGSEYGEAWHKAGMLENKQNVFDDFIAAAEYLIAQKYTSSERLAINGGSNGGLLVGACEVQRPDLYAVCLPQVGVMDMLRYHKFTIGWGWAVEYGSSDNEEQFPYIYKYSPLHNIKEGVKYPATLVMTADHDDRVVPAHSFKFAAQMQHCQAGEAPVLIRIESKAGHGAGKPTSKRIDEAADMYAFLFQNIGVPYRPVGE
ncbi:prolyl oligopeptidase family serine peptidase [Alistipes sp. An66]|uniref:prolyl oligopeptidase family serine peptidase n=1 Tax=Alistipes sp. An66 TaxID=1965650 RepID=UPI000B3ACA2E|nr:prolyl oligopeptidase family serine peptidase [Alistipes sp. An66]OUN58861.1 S9 family peptidase [Alistipes sp. An66]